MPKSFRPAYNKYVEAKSILFLIKGHESRIIKNIIKNINSSMSNLILHDVAVVDNFYCNIMSENRLIKAGVWFCGFDATLRIGNLQENRIVCQLKKIAQSVLFIIHPEFFLFFGCFYTCANECQPRYGGGSD
jgi:hypothetical protein